MTFEIEVILPVLLKFASVSVIVGSLTSLSTQGVKAMLNMEVSGNFARIITVLMAMFYSVLTVFYNANGTIMNTIIASSIVPLAM